MPTEKKYRRLIWNWRSVQHELLKRIKDKLANSLAIPADRESSLDHPAVQHELLKRIKDKLAPFPGYAKIFRVVATLEPWTVEAGLITPTLKLKRDCLIEQYEDVIIGMYEGH